MKLKAKQKPEASSEASVSLQERIRATCAEAKAHVEQEAQRVKNSDEGRTLPLTWLVQNIYAVHRAHGCHCRAALALITQAQDKKHG
jgi:hypothetical protein